MSILPKLCLLAMTGVLPATALQAQSYAPPELYGADAIGRSMPSPTEVRTNRRDRFVGVFYFLWLHQKTVYDNSLILRDNPLARSTNASPPWGPINAFHFWGEPLFGYYRSEDPWVLRRHAALLSDAGVDFLVFDATNGLVYEKVVLPLCGILERQRKLGEHVPQITFMVNSAAERTAQRIYELIYKPSRYPELWFQWKDKPLLLCDPNQASKEVADFFTLRKAHWPFKLVDTHNAWHWEATYPQVYSYDTDPSQPEQVNVSVGQNLHQTTGRVEMMSTGNARGRSFHEGRTDDRPHAYQYGFNFEEQWQRAHELDPEVVFVTGWNEWIAMQLNKKQGPPVFCDQFDLEFSRDVEMMKGGYGDNYYLQMAANIRHFKGMQPAEAAPEGQSIDLAGAFEQWSTVTPVFKDHAHDTEARDFPGCGKHYYRVNSGRNDFRVLKVTRDHENIYFYAETSEPITPRTDPAWMWLLLNITNEDSVTEANSGTEEDGDPDIVGPNWEGFTYVLNRNPAEPDKISVETCKGGWQWQSIGQASYRVAGRQLHIAVPKTLLNLTDDAFVIDFKWVDNTQQPGDPLDLYTHGDTAPESRFRYRYRTTPVVSRQSPERP